MTVATDAARDALDDMSLLVDRLAARAAQCYEPRVRAVEVLVVVKGPRCEYMRLFRLGAACEAVAGAAAALHLRRDADAILTLTRDTLESILASPTTFDTRSERFRERIDIAGDAQAAHHLLQLLKRPTPASLVRLERARAKAPRYLPRVPETSHADAPAVFDAIASSRPLCVRGALDWPACAWTLEQVAERYGDAPLSRRADGREVSMREFIASVQAAAGTAPYTDGCLLPPVLEPLFGFPFFKPMVFSRAQIWAGARRDDALVTRLHCDVATSFLAQVHGRKKVRLFPPCERERLYAMSAFNLYQPCYVDAGQPDLAQFPDFASARYADVVVDAGDLLIVPTGWYHCVWALDDVLSVSRFIGDEIAGLFFA